MRAYRARALLALCQALVFLATFAGGLVLGQMVWRNRVERVVARSQPLVAAILAFTANRGHPPETLNDLTPQYIRDVPSTGIGSFPNYRYVLGEPNHYDGNPWVLIVTPPVSLGFDSLMYFPLQNYPARGYGGGVERIGTWGYVHE